jgi:hypothetical protein
MAVVASILTAIYHMLKDGTMYKDLGRDHFDRCSSDQQISLEKGGSLTRTASRDRCESV